MGTATNSGTKRSKEVTKKSRKLAMNLCLKEGMSKKEIELPFNSPYEITKEYIKFVCDKYDKGEILSDKDHQDAIEKGWLKKRKDTPIHKAKLKVKNKKKIDGLPPSIESSKHAKELISLTDFNATKQQENFLKLFIGIFGIPSAWDTFKAAGTLDIYWKTNLNIICLTLYPNGNILY